MIDWEGILPTKADADYIDDELAGGFDIAIKLSIKYLKAAEEKGEICKPLNKVEFIDMLDTYDLVDGYSIDRVYDTYLEKSSGKE